MTRLSLLPGLVATAVCVAPVATTQAADLRINGFASIGAGLTISEGKDIAPGSNSASTDGNATFLADSPTNARYDDDIDFRPDSIYGLQITSALGEGLSATGQITGTGGEDFDATVAWAYVSYDLDDNWTLLAGRQRIPLYFYSDFLDVGYAYHWVRPPSPANSIFDSYDGAQLRHQGSIGSWDTRVQLFAGSAETTGDFDIGLDDLAGAVFYASNDWLQLRAVYSVGDFWVSLSDDISIQSESDPVGASFAGVAANASFGNAFAVAEIININFDDPLLFNGSDSTTGWYVSVGYRTGSLTPYLTLGSETDELHTTILNPATGDDTTDFVSMGMRWDFHSQASFKLEYESRSDESDADIVTAYGDRNEVDLLSASIDLLF